MSTTREDSNEIESYERWIYQEKTLTELSLKGRQLLIDFLFCCIVNLLDREVDVRNDYGRAEQPAEFSRVFVLCLSKIIQTNEKKTRTPVLRSIRNRSHRLVSIFLS